MGADLVGWFAKGPKALTRAAIAKAMVDVNARLQWLQKARRARDADDDVALASLLPDCPWVDPEAPGDVDPVALRCEIDQLLDAAGEIDQLNGEQAVQEFIDNWPPNDYRDAAHITDPSDPNVVIVFAGERTWGDPPSGLGFALLSRASVLGIGAALGVWIEAAFITIPVHLPTKGTQDDTTQ